MKLLQKHRMCFKKRWGLWAKLRKLGLPMPWQTMRAWAVEAKGPTHRLELSGILYIDF